MTAPPSPTEESVGAPSSHKPPRLFRQLALQCAAVIAVMSLAWPYFGLRGEALPWPETALAIGTMALLLSRISHQPGWWQAIHAVFAPLAWAVSLLDIAPGWFLLAFVVLLLFFRGAATGQIPLYLTNDTTIHALTNLLAAHPGARFVDLGAGIGSTIAPLSRALPDAHFTGIENAPASWTIGWLRTRSTPNVRWRMGSFWELPLGEFNVAYAFLSPTPMPDLWQKIQREMKAGSVFVSNSFAIPDIEADEILELEDDRETRLYCYRLRA